MNRRIKNLLSCVFILCLSGYLSAQGVGDGGSTPTPPPFEGGGDQQTSPIDMYTVYLLILAVGLILYFSYKIWKKHQLENLKTDSHKIP